MKKTALVRLISTVVTVCALVFLVPTAQLLASGTKVYYSLPYLHTSTDKLVSCVIANLSSTSGITSTFTVSSEHGATAVTTPVSISLPAIGAHRIDMLTFSGLTITNIAGTTKGITFVNSGTLLQYSGGLTFSSTIADSISCQNVLMSCFQGTTNPKRNVMGTVCEDDSATGPNGSSNVISH